MTAVHQILKLSCPDRPGLVAGVARLLADNGGNILNSEQFNDTETKPFFMRVVFELAEGATLDGVPRAVRTLCRSSRHGMDAAQRG